MWYGVANINSSSAAQILRQPLHVPRMILVAVHRPFAGQQVKRTPASDPPAMHRPAIPPIRSDIQSAASWSLLERSAQCLHLAALRSFRERIRPPPPTRRAPPLPPERTAVAAAPAPSPTRASTRNPGRPSPSATRPRIQPAPPRSAHASQETPLSTSGSLKNRRPVRV